MGVERERERGLCKSQLKREKEKLKRKKEKFFLFFSLQLS